MTDYIESFLEYHSYRGILNNNFKNLINYNFGINVNEITNKFLKTKELAKIIFENQSFSQLEKDLRDDISFC